MSVKLSTTGTLSTVTIGDFGDRAFDHPTVDYVLSDEFSYAEIRQSKDLGAAIDAGYITITNDGDDIISSAYIGAVQPQLPVGAVTEMFKFMSEDFTLTTSSTDTLTLSAGNNHLRISSNANGISELNTVTLPSLSHGCIYGITNNNTNANRQVKLMDNEPGAGTRFYTQELLVINQGVTKMFYYDSDKDRLIFIG